MGVQADGGWPFAILFLLASAAAFYWLVSALFGDTFPSWSNRKKKEYHEETGEKLDEKKPPETEAPAPAPATPAAAGGGSQGGGGGHKSNWFGKLIAFAVFGIVGLGLYYVWSEITVHRQQQLAETSAGPTRSSEPVRRYEADCSVTPKSATEYPASANYSDAIVIPNGEGFCSDPGPLNAPGTFECQERLDGPWGSCGRHYEAVRFVTPVPRRVWTAALQEVQ